MLDLRAPLPLLHGVSFSSLPSRQQSGEVRGGTFHRIALLFQPISERRQVAARDPRIKVVLTVIIVVEVMEKWPFQYVARMAAQPHFGLLMRPGHVLTKAPQLGHE